jgi:hypothetical protein
MGLGRHALYLFEGARVHLTEADVWLAGPEPGGGFRALAVALAASDVDVRAAHPTVRMMAETIALAREAGVRGVIVGTPIPYEAMRNSLGYDPAVYAARFAVMRRAAEAAGAAYVDLHEALPSERFRDAVGHFDGEGAKLLAGLRPTVDGCPGPLGTPARADTQRAPTAVTHPERRAGQLHPDDTPCERTHPW